MMIFKTRIACMMYMYKLAGEFIEKYLMEFTDYCDTSVIFAAYKHENEWRGEFVLDYDTGNDTELLYPDCIPDFIREFTAKNEADAPIKIINLSTGATWLESFCVNNFLSKDKVKCAVLSTECYDRLLKFIYHKHNYLYNISDKKYGSYAIQYDIPINFNSYLENEKDLYTKLDLNIQNKILIDTLSYKPSKEEIKKELNK